MLIEVSADKMRGCLLEKLTAPSKIQGWRCK